MVKDHDPNYNGIVVRVLGESLRRWPASSTRPTPAPPRTRRRPGRTLTVLRLGLCHLLRPHAAHVLTERRPHSHADERAL